MSMLKKIGSLVAYVVIASSGDVILLSCFLIWLA
jgi:hypothetical protein